MKERDEITNNEIIFVQGLKLRVLQQNIMRPFSRQCVKKILLETDEIVRDLARWELPITFATRNVEIRMCK